MTGSTSSGFPFASGFEPAAGFESAPESKLPSNRESEHALPPVGEVTLPLVAANKPVEFRAALLTPGGRGALAVIRVVGLSPRWDERAVPRFRAASGRPWSELTLGRIWTGWWGHTAPEQIVVSRLTETTAELICHGGLVASRRILQDLRADGCAIVSPRHVLSGEHPGDVLLNELQAAIPRATTWKTVEPLLRLANGQWHRTWTQWCETLQPFTSSPADEPAMITALRSKSSESNAPLSQPASPNRSLGGSPPASAVLTVRKAIRRALSHAHWGRHLTRPYQVALVGPPNVGKSSLMNALVGFRRAIVFEEPGTTRDLVTALTAIHGWPVQLCDTAGIRETSDPLEAAGIELALRRRRASDLVITVIDASALWDHNNLSAAIAAAIETFHAANQNSAGGAATSQSRSLWVLNKIDRLAEAAGMPAQQAVAQITEALQQALPDAEVDAASTATTNSQCSGPSSLQIVPVSAVTGAGLKRLQKRIIQQLVPQVPRSDDVFPVTRRQQAWLCQVAQHLRVGDIHGGLQSLWALRSCRQLPSERAHAGQQTPTPPN
jgi:tRNA modification GTPase